MSQEKPPQPSIANRDSKPSFKQRIMETLSPVTDRSFNEYLSHLGLESEDLSGKIILDIGSGAKERFSKEAEKYGAKVYSINPKLKSWMARKELQDSEWQKRSIAARAQQLPFKDNQFDIITSLYAFPVWFIKKDMAGVLKEMIRVLRPSGKIYLAPRDDDAEKIFGQDTIEWLRENGCSINSEQTDKIIITKNE